MIRNSFNEKINDVSNGGVICLVGPSGSLKNDIANELQKRYSKYEKPITSTTRPRRGNESGNAYRFISEDTFVAEKDAGKYIESTVYSRYHFGTSLDEISPIPARGHYAIIPIDVCGALTIKNEFRKNSLLVFVNRDKKAVVKDIVERDIEADDKVRRIMSLDFEYRNAEVCDVELKVGNDAKEAADALSKMIETKFTHNK
jgi:guanylate kinase